MSALHLLLDVEPHNGAAGTGVQVADDSAGLRTDKTENWVSGTETASYEIRANVQKSISQNCLLIRVQYSAHTLHIFGWGEMFDV